MMKRNNEPLVRETMASLFLKEVPVSLITCHGCGEPVTKLPQEEADNLRDLESFEGLEVLGIAAFDCTNCRTVIFEDELFGGARFVPPDFLPSPVLPSVQEIGRSK